MTKEFVFVFALSLLAPGSLLEEFSGDGEVKEETRVFKHRCHCRLYDCDSRGECLDGDTCQDGWSGPGCQYECTDGIHGQDCAHNCSKFCAKPKTTDMSTCHHVTGRCLSGCQQGYDGLNCSNFKNQDSVAEGISAYIIGPFVGISCILLAAVIAYGILARYRWRTLKINSSVKSAESRTVDADMSIYLIKSADNAE
ncbi:unnamed protein product [Lymnaea stagnalis]|uniref:EGF-like domain-containing protein n=1 Tax=Lymnaea stagnalis TaxID=6523 RepID=A0AAV2H786_LYMST